MISSMRRMVVDGNLVAQNVIESAGQMSAVVETDEVFKNIIDKMKTISDQITTVDSTVKGILTSKDKVVYSIERISAVSHEAVNISEEAFSQSMSQMSELDNLLRRSMD